MKTIHPYLYAMISDAVKITGSYDPDETMFYFEEHLTPEDYDEIRAFLKWCHENGKAFGHGNYNERFAEFKAENES